MIAVAFYKVTMNGNEGHEKMCVYNKGCNFRCLGCAYKVPNAGIGPSDSEREIGTQQVIELLRKKGARRVHFIGGEPLINADLARIAEFAHEELEATTVIGHSNGSKRVPDFIDEATISIKAFDDVVHKAYTGVSNGQVLTNFKDAYERGVKMKASTVLIPGIITPEEVEGIAVFISELDRRIPFHITAYMPVPDVGLRAPSDGEMGAAVLAAKRHLSNVSGSMLDAKTFSAMKEKDPAFRSHKIDLE